MSDALHIDGLELRFGSRVLLDGFSLVAPMGGRSTIAGPSGCGKSTLLKCVLGFEQPAAGSIRLFGAELKAASVWGLRRKLAWVPQEPELGEGTAREFLAHMFGYRTNRGDAGRLGRADELAREFLLDGSILGQPVGRLSGGEKQRVALIAALLLERPLLLVDEPFSALDPEARAAVRHHLSQLQAAIICAAHEPLGLDGEQVVRLGAGRRRDDD